MYKIKFSFKAAEDLENIYDYISVELCNIIAADNLINKIEQSVYRLKDFPYSCSYVLDDILKSKGYRKLVVENYIIFYLVDETNQNVTIMRILYGAQKYQDLL